jgi:ribosome-associated protein YbcJ (S4-like RNA binding protein)
MSEGIRLNRYLAQSGVASRRACDQIIAEGRVSVNGNPVIAPGTRVAEGDHVKVDGRRVRPNEATTILLHKPRGLVCTKSDELGRDTIYSLLPGSHRRLAHVGRLDRDSEGLLVLTSDGDFARQAQPPLAGVWRRNTWSPSTAPSTSDTIDRLVAGVYTDGRAARRQGRPPGLRPPRHGGPHPRREAPDPGDVLHPQLPRHQARPRAHRLASRRLPPTRQVAPAGRCGDLLPAHKSANPAQGLAAAKMT